jgi:hypothetical protein
VAPAVIGAGGQRAVVVAEEINAAFAEAAEGVLSGVLPQVAVHRPSGHGRMTNSVRRCGASGVHGPGQ